MARDGEKEPLLTEQHEVQDPKLEDDCMVSNKSRKLRRNRSAPMVVLQESSLNEFVKGPQPIYDQLSPNYKRVATYFFIYLGISIICFYLVENQLSGVKTYKILDSIYFFIVTMTTVGYGDLSPNSTLTKLLACAFVFLGMALIGLCLGLAADCLVVNQERFLIKAMRARREANSMEPLIEMEARIVRYRCIVFSIVMVILIPSGTVFLTMVEKMDIVDAFYCVCLTITTLGYRYISFSTPAGRLFAIFWILICITCLAILLFAFIELYIESRKRSRVEWILRDMEAADAFYQDRYRSM